MYIEIYTYTDKPLQEVAAGGHTACFCWRWRDTNCIRGRVIPCICGRSYSWLVWVRFPKYSVYFPVFATFFCSGPGGSAAVLIFEALAADRMHATLSNLGSPSITGWSFCWLLCNPRLSTLALCCTSWLTPEARVLNAAQAGRPASIGNSR